jgi:hypothetical protein
MDLGATLVLIGAGIPGSGLLGGARPDPAAGQRAFPAAAHGDAAATQTGRRFDLADLGPFGYSTPAAMTAFIGHLAGIEDQLRLLRSFDGMLTAGDMPEYLFRRTHGVVGLLRRLIEDGCAQAITTGGERLSRELLAGIPIRLGRLADLDPDAGEIPDIPGDDVPPPEPKKNAGPGTRSSTTAAPARPLVGEGSAPVPARALPRSMDPLAGESLQGFLLRLSCRLRIAPLRLARLTGCTAATSQGISRQAMLDLGTEAFAWAARLTGSEAAVLTLVPWAARYPPIGRALSRSSPHRPAIREAWLFTPGIRYCPSCLRGDLSPVQEKYGGPWQKYWLLPIAFACPRHRVLLTDGCPQEHSPAEQGNWQLIRHADSSTLHPAQCRRAAHAAGRGRNSPPCGARLDLAGAAASPGQDTIEAQQRLLGLLGDLHSTETAVSIFTDIRVVTALLCDSWPLGRDLMDPRMAAAASEHVRQLNASSYRALDKPPRGILATAGLLTAAIAVLDGPDLAGTVARHAQARKAGSPSKSSWARVLGRHHPACSPALRDAAEPATRAYRRTAGPNSTRAPSRAGGYRPEHIPPSCRKTGTTSTSPASATGWPSRCAAQEPSPSCSGQPAEPRETPRATSASGSQGLPTSSHPTWSSGSASTAPTISPQPCTALPRNWTPPPASPTISTAARPCANGAWTRAHGNSSPPA